MEVSSWENHLFLWAIYTMAMLNNQRVSWDIEKLRQVVNPMVDQASGKSQCLDPCYAGDECVWSPSTEKV